MHKPIIFISCMILPVLAFCPIATIVAGEDPAPQGVAETAADIEMKPTEIGIRFTPGIARAIGLRMSQQMKSQYDLDESQVGDIQGIISHQVMRLVHDNAKTGRDMIEMMVETMIKNDGNFPEKDAIKFAKLAKPAIPALKKFFIDSSAAIGKRMTLKQRLQLTGDMAKVTAGLAVFENRMNRWEEGKTGEFANPFYDSDDNLASTDDSEPEDPNESPEHRKIRRRVESWIDSLTDVDKLWDAYLKQAIAYYNFDESQKAAAQAILKDCKERAKAIITPEFRKRIKEFYIIQQMTYGMEYEKGMNSKMINQGPWRYHLNRAREDLMKPLKDLGQEMRRRIEGLPTSQQRAEANAKVLKVFADKGVKKFPF